MRSCWHSLICFLGCNELFLFLLLPLILSLNLLLVLVCHILFVMASASSFFYCPSSVLAVLAGFVWEDMLATENK
jgi:hypothetical protein